MLLHHNTKQKRSLFITCHQSFDSVFISTMVVEKADYTESMAITNLSSDCPVYFNYIQ